MTLYKATNMSINNIKNIALYIDILIITNNWYINNACGEKMIAYILTIILLWFYNYYIGVTDIQLNNEVYV